MFIPDLYFDFFFRETQPTLYVTNLYRMFLYEKYRNEQSTIFLGQTLHRVEEKHIPTLLSEITAKPRPVLTHPVKV